MNFLKKAKDEEEKKRKKVEVTKLYKITVRCDDCEYWGKMEGGPLPDSDNAIFICPKCEHPNSVKWCDFG